jgi:hypothetical protein
VSGANVSLSGAWGIETINGGAGNSTIDASSGSLTYGNSGILITSQNAGADSLIGGGGADTLQAATSNLNANNDTLTGGAGLDLFVIGDSTTNFYGNNGAGPTANPVVRITDFAASDNSGANGDMLMLYGNGLEGSDFGINYSTLVIGDTINVYKGASPVGAPQVYFGSANTVAGVTTLSIYRGDNPTTGALTAEVVMAPGTAWQEVFRNAQFQTS